MKFSPPPHRKNLAASFRMRPVEFLCRLGQTYIHRRGLPGRPDIVFTKGKVAVFVDGDFWHGRDWEKRKAAGQFKTRRKFWISKIERNIARDRIVNCRLYALGWGVLRFWVSDIAEDGGSVVEAIKARLKRRRIS